MSAKVEPTTPKAMERRSMSISITISRRNSTSLLKPDFKFSEALAAAHNEQSDDPRSMEDFRMQMKKFMSHSPAGLLYENILLFISCISTLEFIYQTYLDPHENGTQLRYFGIVELIFASLFSLDWLLNFSLADIKMIFATSFESMIDLMFAIPMFITYNTTCPTVEGISNFKETVIYILFAFKTTRVLRVLKVKKKLYIIKDAVERYIGEISINITVLILFLAAIVQFLEATIQPLPFHVWMYYVWVSIATVGYGDITPSSTMGRVCAMAMIAFAIISIPKMTNELIEKMKLQSVYARASYLPKTALSKHIVICGDLSSTSLKDFFEELFHEDHENVDLSAVILAPMPPSVEIALMLRDPKFYLSLTYLEGSALVDDDLKRAKVASAVAVFIMTNKFTMYPDEEDAKTILQNFSIRRYVSNESFSLLGAESKMFCMQVIRPENLRQLARGEVNGDVGDNNLVVCLNEIKMGVLAKAVMYPGTNTFLLNLITSFSDDDLGDSEDADVSMNNVEGAGESGSNKVPTTWIKEYAKGCDWEIYTTELADMFVGSKFSELSIAIYEKYGVVLFALKITSLKKKKNTSRLLLNPAHFVIPEKDKYRVAAFVIAKNKATSDLSFAGKKTDDKLLEIINRNMSNFASALTHASAAANPINEKRKTMVTANQSSKSTASSASDGKKVSKWNSLKRAALLEKKVQSFSYQEILQRLEDQHFKENYYLRSAPAELSDALVRTDVVEEVPYINNHVIIIGKDLNNLYDLIRPLRAKYLGVLKYIVILHPLDIPYDVWHRISIFDCILVVRGSPLEEVNLRRAGIFRAQEVVVLADGSSSMATKSGMEALVDSDAIFAYQCVKRMNPVTQVVIEIIKESNIGYLIADEIQRTGNTNYKFSNQFAAGTLFTTSLLDSLICQAYYNPHIIQLVNAMLSGVDQMERAELPQKASAQATDTATNNDAEEDVSDDDDDEHNINASSSASHAFKMSDIHGSCLYQIPLPEKFEAQTYGKLFQHLAAQGVIPLGLYRGILAGMNIGPKSNKMPYVYTNPDKNTVLYACDRVFVLATKPPASHGKTSVKDWILGLQMQENRGKSANKSSSKLNRSGAEKSLAVTDLERSQAKLEKKLAKLSEDVNLKFKAIMENLSALSSAIKAGTGAAASPVITAEALRQNNGDPPMIVTKERRYSIESNLSVMSGTVQTTQSVMESSEDEDIPAANSNSGKEEQQQQQQQQKPAAPSPVVSERKSFLKSVIGLGRKDASSQPAQDKLAAPAAEELVASPTESSKGILKNPAAAAVTSSNKKRHSFSDPVVQTVALVTVHESENSAEEKDGGSVEGRAMHAGSQLLGTVTTLTEYAVLELHEELNEIVSDREDEPEELSARDKMDAEEEEEEEDAERRRREDFDDALQEESNDVVDRSEPSIGAVYSELSPMLQQRKLIEQQRKQQIIIPPAVGQKSARYLATTLLDSELDEMLPFATKNKPSILSPRTQMLMKGDAGSVVTENSPISRMQSHDDGQPPRSGRSREIQGPPMIAVNTKFRPSSGNK